MFNYKEQRYFKVARTLHTGKRQAESIIKKERCMYLLFDDFGSHSFSDQDKYSRH